MNSSYKELYKKAWEVENSNPEEAIKLLRVANDMVLQNYNPINYMLLIRLPTLLKRIKRFDLAKLEEDKIKQINLYSKKIKLNKQWLGLINKYGSHFHVEIKPGSFYKECPLHKDVWGKIIQGNQDNWDNYISKLYSTDSCKCWIAVNVIHPANPLEQHIAPSLYSNAGYSNAYELLNTPDARLGSTNTQSNHINYTHSNHIADDNNQISEVNFEPTTPEINLAYETNEINSSIYNTRLLPVPLGLPYTPVEQQQEGSYYSTNSNDTFGAEITGAESPDAISITEPHYDESIKLDDMNTVYANLNANVLERKHNFEDFYGNAYEEEAAEGLNRVISPNRGYADGYAGGPANAQAYDNRVTSGAYTGANTPYTPNYRPEVDANLKNNQNLAKLVHQKSTDIYKYIDDGEAPSSRYVIVDKENNSTRHIDYIPRAEVIDGYSDNQRITEAGEPFSGYNVSTNSKLDKLMWLVFIILVIIDFLVAKIKFF